MTSSDIMLTITHHCSEMIRNFLLVCICEYRWWFIGYTFFSVLFAIIFMENVQSLGAALRNSKLGLAYLSPCIYVFNYHWNRFSGIQFVQSHYWFRYWVCVEHAISHYLNQYWLSLLTHIYVSRPQWVKNRCQNACNTDRVLSMLYGNATKCICRASVTNSSNDGWVQRYNNFPPITVTSQWASRCQKSRASRLFAQTLIQRHTKENIKAPRYWSLWGESTDDQWIPLTKGQ